MYCVAIETEEEIVPNWIRDILLKEDWRLLLSWDKNIWFKEEDKGYCQTTEYSFEQLYHKYPDLYKALGKFWVMKVDEDVYKNNPPCKVTIIEEFFTEAETISIQKCQSPEYDMMTVISELSEERYKKLRELCNTLNLEMYILEQGMWAIEYTKYKLFFEDNEK